MLQSAVYNIELQRNLIRILMVRQVLALANSIEQRKSDHIQITLNEKVTGESISTGLESFVFIHNALPEIAFDEISIETTFLGFDMQNAVPYQFHDGRDSPCRDN